MIYFFFFQSESPSEAKTPLTTTDGLPSEKLLSRQKLQMKKRLSLERYRGPPALSLLNVNRENNVLKSQFKPPSTLKK